MPLILYTRLVTLSNLNTDLLTLHTDQHVPPGIFTLGVIRAERVI